MIMPVFRVRSPLALMVLPLLACASLAFAQDDGYAPGVVLVKFRDGADHTMVDRVIQRHGLQLSKVLPRVNVQRMRIPAGESEVVLARLLASYSTIVEFAEPDYRRSTRHIPNDPMFFQQLDLMRIQMPTVWEATKGSRSVIVAVLDTGIDLDHPDLVNALWQNPGEFPGNSVDDDHNGYVDDVAGYDFAGDGANPKPADEDGVPNDTLDHATHVSGTIVAQQNNNIGVSGIAPRCRVMPVRVLGGLLGSGYSSDIIEGITYAVDNGAKVINMSLGGTSKSMGEFNALKYAWTHNVFIAAASGNSGDGRNPIEYPSAYPFTMSVGATDINDIIGYFSTFNAFVEVVAPGVDILSTVPDDTYAQTNWSGTSMATPHVSGLAALLYSQYPGIANWEVRAMLQSGTVKLGTPAWDPHFGYGRIDGLLTFELPRPSPTKLKLLTPAPGSVHPAGSITAYLWNPVVGAKNYRLFITKPGGAFQLLTTKSTFYAVNPGAPVVAGPYQATVDALDRNGRTISSDSVSFSRTD